MVYALHFWFAAREGEACGFIAKRRFPVHPEVAALLARWKLSGFESVFGRSPRDMKARKLNGVCKALIEDEKRVGIEHQRGRATHGSRKAWISMAAAAGVDRECRRVLTHGGRKRDVMELYERWPWETLCDAVQHVQLPNIAQVIELGGRRA